MGPLGFRT